MMISPASLSMLDKRSGGLPVDGPCLESTRPHNQSYDSLQALVCCTLALLRCRCTLEKILPLPCLCSPHGVQQQTSRSYHDDSVFEVKGSAT